MERQKQVNVGDSYKRWQEAISPIPDASDQERFMRHLYKPDLWARDDKDKFVSTNEHMLPQTERISADWVEVAAGGDRVKVQYNHAEHVDRFGNLP